MTKMTIYDFTKHSNYSRRDVIKIVTGKDEQPYGKWVSGYNREGDNLFVFMNIGIPGRTGHDYKNTYDRETEEVSWCGKSKTHSNQPVIKQIINGDLSLYVFARWERHVVDFEYLGIGKVISFEDDVPVADRDANDSFCIEFKLTCKESGTNAWRINNFDEAFEESIPETGTEGAVRYVIHKNRERNFYIVEKKKKEFLKKEGKVYCEVCLFDFKETYGLRGKGFIECHHNIPLHETEENKETKTSDLSLLCSNCHRMIHRKKDWLTIKQLKDIYKNSHKL